MADEVNCKKCDSLISKNAHYCPHCRSAQNTKAMLKQYIPLIVIFTAIFSFTMLFSSVNKNKQYTPPPSFSVHTKDVVVTSSEMSFSECGECKSKFNAVVIGIIKNNTDYSWEDFKIEVRFYNKEGVMIDTMSDTAYGVAVLPDGEVSFRVMARAAKPVEEYFSQKVFLNSASYVSDYY